MAMELETVIVPAATHKFGDDLFAVSAGQTLKIETTPGGYESLNVGPPEGKQWIVVRVIVEITEADA